MSIFGGIFTRCAKCQQTHWDKEPCPNPAGAQAQGPSTERWCRKCGVAERFLKNVWCSSNAPEHDLVSGFTSKGPTSLDEVPRYTTQQVRIGQERGDWMRKADITALVRRLEQERDLALEQFNQLDKTVDGFTADVQRLEAENAMLRAELTKWIDLAPVIVEENAALKKELGR